FRSHRFLIFLDLHPLLVVVSYPRTPSSSDDPTWICVERETQGTPSTRPIITQEKGTELCPTTSINRSVHRGVYPGIALAQPGSRSDIVIGNHVAST
ncbi:hypothetical protein, partial [Sporisorium scitamineum]